MIRIIDEAPLYLSREEAVRYRRQYQRECMYRVDPPSFETWARARKRDEDARHAVAMTDYL